MTARRKMLLETIRRGLVPDNLPRLVQASERFFLAEPCMATFLARSVFRAIASVCDEKRTIATKPLENYRKLLLPKLEAWFRSDESFTDSSLMEEVVRATWACEASA